MMRPPLSSAATSLLRAVINRTGLPRDRILLREFRSVDWHSLTYQGERHCISLRLPPPHAAETARALTDGLEDAEFEIGGHLVADIALACPPIHGEDGSIGIEIEALTLAEA
ncbi:hypothetical protein [Sphingomicrobium aestuariivivum]|uniref:hypothetical protein n=1 Tax=Sphingomicrobium aestuariivivum TaxID=1582356 RepID=UPI001FD6CE0A|nr:hypothetical protein [Sphingomicrobium aestuariivivum]MCJ8191873.1 hypothetical protein [Sphingomicrobium aestuariivivum]